MPLDGSGNYTRARDWTTDEGNSLNIEASLFDEHDDDLATALNAAFYRDGQAPATGTFDMNGNKIDLDADADTSIHADTDDQIDFEVGGSDIMRMTSNGLIPVTVAPVMYNYIGGIVPNQDTDTEHDINFTAGMASDSGNAASIFLTSEITKQVDATWAAGDDAGGLFSGSVAATTWYHFFVIRNPTTGVVDAGFDTSAVAANAPAGYTQYRWVGAGRTDGSSNWLDFQAYEMSGGGVLVYWDVPQQDYNNTNPGATRVTVTMNFVAPDCWGICNVAIEEDTPAGDNEILITRIGQTDTGPGLALSNAHFIDATDGVQKSGTSMGEFRVDASRQLHFRVSTSTADVLARINVHGWWNPRR